MTRLLRERRSTSRLALSKPRAASHRRLTVWCRPVWPFQPELMNEVFDGIDGQEGAGRGPTGTLPLSPDRREYMSLAAVPRLSRPSWDPKVPDLPPPPLRRPPAPPGCARLHRWWCFCCQTPEGSHNSQLTDLTSAGGAGFCFDG